MNNIEPINQDLLLIGGGHSHVSVLKQLAMHPIPGLQITLVSRTTLAPYSGMLPGYIAGHYTRQEMHIDLNRLCRFANARFIKAEASGLNLAQQTVQCLNLPPLRYDYLSINTGSTPNWHGIEGAEKHAIPIKPIDVFEQRWLEAKSQIEQLVQQQSVHIGVVGVGAGGVETILAIAHQLTLQLDNPSTHKQLQFYLIGQSSTILPSHNTAVRAIFEKVLQQKNINIQLNFTVSSVTDTGITDDKGHHIKLDYILWLTQASPAHWPTQSGLAVDQGGFIAVNDYLQSISHANVFASGDIASMINYQRPKSGVFAVRQGPTLVKNLTRIIASQSLKAYHPQSKFLSLLTTGEKNAIMSWGRFSLHGRWVWRWKDWIDRRFMERFNALSPMTEKHSITSHWRSKNKNFSHKYCAGCGSKIPSVQIRSVLSRLQPYRQEGLDNHFHEDDGAIITWPKESVQVHTIDGFKALVSDPYLCGQITAHHALNDIFAMGAIPHTALAMVSLPHAKPSSLENTLEWTLSGILQVLNQERCSLIGGHSNQSQDFSIALAITGQKGHHSLLKKRIDKSEHSLILTKALGIGTLFAMDMQLSSKGDWIESAVASMLKSNAGSVTIFHQHQVAACTDISGFGLAGHLSEMLMGSGYCAQLNLTQIPLLPGAKDSLERGIESSQAPMNHSFMTNILNESRSPYLHKILVDPQTSGGLLAAVPKDKTITCLNNLLQLGYDAAIIGRIIPKVNNSNALMHLID